MDLKSLIRGKDFALLRNELEQCNVATLLPELAKLKPYDQAIVFRAMDPVKASRVFSYLESNEQKQLIKNLTQKELVGILDNLAADDSADFLATLPAGYMDALLDSLDEESKENINKLLKYESNTVGSIMTVEYLSIDPEMTVAEAFEKLRSEAADSETIYTTYVLEEGKLIGIVTAKDLILGQPDKHIRDIMNPRFVSLKATENKSEAAKIFQKYGFFAIPVVYKNMQMQGIVTIDDGFYVLQDEVTEDMQKMAGMQADDSGYFNKSIWYHAKQRVAWLLFLMITAGITGAIINRYEDAVKTLPLLVAFIPMLMGTAGNSGAQTATLIIRGITTQEIKFRDIFRIIWTEFRVSLVVSGILALTNGFVIYFQHHDMRLAMVVSLSLILTVLVAKFIGAILPLFASKVKLDPAVMAAPLITTIVDSACILIYFNIASVLFGL